MWGICALKLPFWLILIAKWTFWIKLLACFDISNCGNCIKNEVWCWWIEFLRGLTRLRVTERLLDMRWQLHATWHKKEKINETVKLFFKKNCIMLQIFYCKHVCCVEYIWNHLWFLLHTRTLRYSCSYLYSLSSHDQGWKNTFDADSLLFCPIGST